MEEAECVKIYAHVSAQRIGAAGQENGIDAVAVEEPLEILLGERNLAITMRTPGHDEELAAGFLFTEGIAQRASQIRSIRSSGNRAVVELTDAPATVPDERRFTMTSACGVCGKASADSLFATTLEPLPAGTLRIGAGTIRALPATLREAQTGFQQTGGMHAAALFYADGRLDVIREDVGRHNAVDKVIGALLKADRLGDAADRVLLVSSRASYELVQKAAMAGIPVLAAIGAPSSMAIATAERFGVTLIGFLREERFTIYAGPARIAV